MKTTTDYPKESRCRSWGLHDFFTVARWSNCKESMVNAGRTEFKETCRKCSKSLVWREGAGGKDRLWLKYHARDALQPLGRDREMFRSEYGSAALERLKTQYTASGSYDDITVEAKEDLKTNKRSTFL